MTLIADLHIHSHFSRATSPNLTFEHLTRWAQLKGIAIVGSGDLTHPGWLAEMRERLAPAEEGLFRLNDESAARVQRDVPSSCQAPVRFVLSGEISSIYKRGGQTRKIHNIVFAPSFAAVERLQARLERIGNIRADGRPILGLDSRDLLEIVLEIDPACHLIPAHIWTPWFSLLGSRSGFDAVEACFGDLTPHIFALETGLSSDPPMNWRVSALDRYTLVSNSDAHSPEKLGREANLFDCELAYGALFEALRAWTSPPTPLLPGEGSQTPPSLAEPALSLSKGKGAGGSGATSPPTPLLPGEGSQTPPSLAEPALSLSKGKGVGGLGGTLEFFPEEGKYHFDGHRDCKVVWDPPTTLAHGGLCPTCGKPVTVGVMHRVEALADRPAGGRPERTRPFISLIPLPEVLGEVFGVGAGSKQVEAEYMKLLARLGPELAILRDVPLAEITAAGGERLAEGIGRMRRGEVTAQPGYDGEFGVIRVFAGARVSETQIGLFGEATGDRRQEAGGRGQRGEGARERGSEGAGEQRGGGQSSDLFAVAEAPVEYASISTTPDPQSAIRNLQSDANLLAGLNPEQLAAVLCTDAPLIIVAGPGTGKTRTLTTRIAHLILEKGVEPENILAITFTNKAAGEMRERLEGLLDFPRPLGSPETLKVSSGVATKPLGSPKTLKVSSGITIKTFHAFGAMLLREHAERLGLSPQFVILAEEDRLALLRQVCPELKAGEIEDVLAAISAAKNSGIEPAGGLSAATTRPAEASIPGGAPALAKNSGIEPLGGLSVSRTQPAKASIPFNELHRRYAAALRAGDAVDFDDLILLPIRLLEEHPDVLAATQARYRWISVDEYQDVNAAQYRLLRLLTDRGETSRQGNKEAEDNRVNLCVIGDPDQAIYGFRGADPRYFLRFEQDYPAAIKLSLSKNYRSSQAILEAAAQVIARNPDRKSAEILAQFADEVRLDVYRAATDKAEAEYVVHQIEQMVGGVSYFSIDSARVTGETPAAARSFADFAVLYRLSAQSRPLIEAFDRSGIPYQTVGQTSLYEYKAVREVLAHLWRLYNPRSPLLGVQAMASPMKSGTSQPGLEAVRQPPSGPAGLSGLRTRPAKASIPETYGFPAGAPVARLISQIVETLAAQRRKPLSDADAERLRQLALRAVPFEDRLGDFLEMTALQSETDAYDPRADRVTLMSLHASKGLEFPVVFIVGCEEGLLPYVRVARSETGQSRETDIEEERRLFYVGLTRAGRKLVLTHARKRVLFGQFMENPPSRFVGDIEAALKEIQERKYHPPERKPESGQMSLF